MNPTPSWRASAWPETINSALFHRDRAKRPIHLLRVAGDVTKGVLPERNHSVKFVAMDDDGTDSHAVTNKLLIAVVHSRYHSLSQTGKSSLSAMAIITNGDPLIFRVADNPGIGELYVQQGRAPVSVLSVSAYAERLRCIVRAGTPKCMTAPQSAEPAV